MRGHHELSLIQFEHEIPPMIYELFEITEKKPLSTLENKYIYLGSEEELKKRASEQEKKWIEKGYNSHPRQISY